MKRIVILGAGESGIGSAVLAKQKGFEVFVSDSGAVKPDYKEMLSKYELPYEENGHTESLILNADEVIKSPGIPETAEIIQKIRGKNIPVISEIEFAGRYTHATKICITGSNGKTTTTSLIYHILKKAGLNAGIAGNVGKSFALQVAEENYDYYVIELSSFQLDGMYDFKADIAILLNITPDHLNRYDYQMQNYVDSKFRIMQNLTASDCFIYDIDDEVTAKEMEKRSTPARIYPFSIKETLETGACIEDKNLKIKINDKDFTMSIEELALKGKHNIYNSMAAGIAARVLDIRKEVIRQSLSDFQGIEHRLEHVIKVRGVEFINDSKATNINSTWYALESMTTKVVWIVGGIDKGNDYATLYDLVKEKVKAIVCLGKDNTKIHAAFDDMIDAIVDTQSMEEAVKRSYYLAKSGETVLLSPACASFDLFENYEDRGRKFKDAVRNL